VFFKNFKKKKDALGDQFAVFHKRGAPRYATNAGISIAGFEGEGLLKNISLSGCCLASVTYAAIVPGQVYQVTLVPGRNAGLEPFGVNLTANWTKSSETLFEAGFSLEESRTNHQLEHYVEYLKAQGVEPKYGDITGQQYNGADSR
jgi:hypothetical protein